MGYASAPGGQGLVGQAEAAAGGTAYLPAAKRRKTAEEKAAAAEKKRQLQVRELSLYLYAFPTLCQQLAYYCYSQVGKRRRQAILPFCSNPGVRPTQPLPHQQPPHHNTTGGGSGAVGVWPALLPQRARPLGRQGGGHA